MPELPIEGDFAGVTVPVIDEGGTEHIVQWGRSKEGTKHVLIYFELLDGPNAGTHLPWFGYFTKNSYERTLKSLRLIGWKGNDVADAASQPLNQKVSVSVGHNENPNNGRTYARIDWVNRLGSGTIKMGDPMSAADVRSFSASLRSKTPPEEDGERVERSVGDPCVSDPGDPCDDLPFDAVSLDDPGPSADDGIPF